MVSQIVFVGNERTREEIMLREMELVPGQLYDRERAEKDRLHIYNLGLFYRVEIEPVVTEDGVVLLVYVAERLYLFPYPIIFSNERDWKKLSYGAGLIVQNVSGRNIDLAGSFWRGYNPGADLYYLNPWIGGLKHLSVQLRAYSSSIRSRVLELPRFYQRHRGLVFSLGKRWGHSTHLTLQSSLGRIKVPESHRSVTLSNSGTDDFFSLGLGFRYDTRDLYEYPMSGWRVELSVQRTFPDYHRLGVDLRRYIPLFAGTSVALRAALDWLGGRVPAYRRLYLGYSERIRGHFNSRDDEPYDGRLEGERRAVGNVEFRVPILKRRYLHLDSALGAYGENLPFGLSGALFCDTGAVWSGRRYPRPGTWLSGFGFGLHLHVPYIDLIRLEYAFDERGRGESLLDFMVWF